jgi:quinoprotein glucose dehydrogenase
MDGQTGETLWMYRPDEGARGGNLVRQQSSGLAYWSEGVDAWIPAHYV